MDTSGAPEQLGARQTASLPLLCNTLITSWLDFASPPLCLRTMSPALSVTGLSHWIALSGYNLLHLGSPSVNRVLMLRYV